MGWMRLSDAGIPQKEINRHATALGDNGLYLPARNATMDIRHLRGYYLARA